MFVFLLAASALFPAADGWRFISTTDGRDTYVNTKSVRRKGRLATVQVGVAYPTLKPGDVQGERRIGHFDCARRSQLVYLFPLNTDSEGQLITPKPAPISNGYHLVRDAEGRFLLSVACGIKFRRNNNAPNP